jgi:hypothetical protein
MLELVHRVLGAATGCRHARRYCKVGGKMLTWRESVCEIGVPYGGGYGQ